MQKWIKLKGSIKSNLNLNSFRSIFLQNFFGNEATQL